MGDITNEPSMEEILSSIKRIIAEEGDGAVTASRARAAQRRTRSNPQPASDDAEEGDEVLELTESILEHIEREPAAAAPSAADSATVPELISGDAAQSSRQSLATLSALIVKPEAPGNTLEGLVREMLRPMMKEWLDANLSKLVERMVAKEIARITSRDL